MNMHFFCALVMDMNMLGWMICRDIYHMFILILLCICFCHDLFVVMDVVGTREGKIKWSRHLVIWFRNHEYNILLRKDLWSYYQILGLEFRYALGKVLGIQDRPTLRLSSHHCVLYLSPIKNHLNTFILDLHTH